MRIKAKIWISIAISLLIILVFSLFPFYGYQEVKNTDAEMRVAAMIQEGVFELDMVAYDYLLHGSERAHQQWETRYESLGQTIASAHFDYLQEADLMEKIRQDYEDLDTSFYQLAKAKQAQKSSEEVERLTVQYLLKSQIIFSDAARLHETVSTNHGGLQEMLLWRGLGFVIVLLFVVMGNNLFISRLVSDPIDKLHKATKDLRRGKFETRIKIETGDEFEDLGDAFNKTTEALGRVNEEHKQLDKAKTEFLSITSHELRSPMTPMVAQSQMLLKEYYGKLNKKQKEALKIVLRNTKRLDNIIQDLLEISRIEAARLKFRFAKTDLTKHIKRLVEEMDGFMPAKNIKIVTKIGKLPKIEADPDRTMQVLRNLINNAKKFSPKNTKILVEAKRKDSQVVFSVKDEGIGISKEDQKKIFAPFFQAEKTMYREYGGTGLGLSI